MFLSSHYSSYKGFNLIHKGVGLMVFFQKPNNQIFMNSFNSQYHKLNRFLVQGSKKPLEIKLDYSQIQDIKTQKLLVSQCVQEASNKNIKKINISVINKETLAYSQNASKISFVKNGRSIEGIKSFPFIHPIHGSGLIYESKLDAIRSQGLTKSQYYRNPEPPIYMLTKQEIKLLNGNPFHSLSQTKDQFPLDLLHGSLLSDGSLGPMKNGFRFVIMQSASLGNEKTEHISYFFYLVSLIPPAFLGKKPISIYKNPTHQNTWDLKLSTRSFPLLNYYGSLFYPKGKGTKVIPPNSVLKNLINSYDVVAHIICQDGRVTTYEINLFTSPLSFKGTARVAIALRESLNLKCFVRIVGDSCYVVIIRHSMDAIINNTQHILKHMTYKNIKLIPPNKTKVYEANQLKAEQWYQKYKNEIWVETNEM